MPERKSELKKRKVRRTKATMAKKIVLNNVSFDLYISKLCKRIHPESGLTRTSKQILSSITTIILKIITKNASELAKNGNKITISHKEIQNAVRLFFPGELSKYCYKEGNKAVTKLISSYDEKSNKKKTLSGRAGLMFPVARVGTVIRTVVGSDMRVTKEAPAFLAAVLEYLVSELLYLGGRVAFDNKRVRVQPSDLSTAVTNDYDFENLFKNNKLKNVFGFPITLRVLPELEKKFAFKGSRKRYDDSIQGITKPALKRLLRKAGSLNINGLVYEISRGIIFHRLRDMLAQVITITNSENRKTVSVNDVVMGARSLGIELLPVSFNKKQPKYPIQKRGAKSAKQRQANILRVIRKLQKPNNSMLLIPRAPFQRLVRELGQDYGVNLNYTKDALLLLQTYMENYLVSLFNDALLCAMNAKRRAIKPQDIDLARILRGER